MIADLKPYPAMKDSCVPWLGEVPEHWEMVPNRALLRLKKELVGSNSDDYLLLSLTKQGVVTRDMENPEGKFPAQFDSYQVIEPGDLIFCLFDIDETPRTVGLSSLHGMITGAYTRFVGADETTRRFVYLLYVALDNGKHLKPLYTGLRKVITKSTFLSAKMPLPPPPEQAAIVRFLDHADRRIRRYIRAKQKLIALLEEQKQVLIYGAVTRGLDPNVRLKPSGVEWLGDVPEHWGIRRSKRTFTPRKELARPNDIQLSATQAYGVIAQEDYEERVRRKIVKISRHLEKRRHVEVDDFVISMRSFQGGLERAWVSGCIRSSYIVLQPAARLNVGYFGYLFKSVGYITALQSTANFIRDGQDLNFENFCGVDLPYLPIEEQRRIAQFLDDATADITTTIERSRREIDLFGEYRTRLIADVVTGKLDVRGAADGLPEVDSLADDDALTTQAAETGVMELEDATESPEEFAMENEATV